MRCSSLCTALLAAAFLATSAAQAATPLPLATAPPPKLPTKRLHVDLQVEVNKLGQVVRVPHGNLSGDTTFDMIAMGNALQMWIRDVHGSKVTAVVGLYKVNYDYDPSTQKVKRSFNLLKRGGSWGNDPGAATKMLSNARKAAQDAIIKLKKQQQDDQNKNLPDINGILKQSVKPTAKPTPHA